MARKICFLLAFLFLGVANAAPVEIMFGFVGVGSYYGDGQNLAGKLQAMAGVNVTQRDLFNAVYNDLANFDQIWVYDLNTGPDNNAFQTSNYTNIANWYNARTDKNLIVDGRIVSSADSWIARPTSNGAPSETPWIQNYATQLDLRGGGLVLGTDHATAFTQGINEINSQIGINPFTGFYFTQPLQAVVDTASPLGVSTWDCPTLPGSKCINDNSSTSFVPTNLQPNGQFLTPAAWHGTISTAFDNAAVATTIGSITFPTPEPGTLFLISLGLLGVGGSRYRRRSKD